MKENTLKTIKFDRKRYLQVCLLGWEAAQIQPVCQLAGQRGGTWPNRPWDRGLQQISTPLQTSDPPHIPLAPHSNSLHPVPGGCAFAVSCSAQTVPFPLHPPSQHLLQPEPSVGDRWGVCDGKGSGLYAALGGQSSPPSPHVSLSLPKTLRFTLDSFGSC